MSGLQEMQHLMDNDIFEQVPGFFHQFCVQADVAGSGVTASPLGLHALQEISSDIDIKSMLPFGNQPGHSRVEQ